MNNDFLEALRASPEPIRLSLSSIADLKVNDRDSLVAMGNVSLDLYDNLYLSFDGDGFYWMLLKDGMCECFVDDSVHSVEDILYEILDICWWGYAIFSSQISSLQKMLGQN